MDINLQPNTDYFFYLDNNHSGGGDADLGFAIYSSKDGDYTKGKNDYSSIGDNTGTGEDEHFNFTTADDGQSDRYGLVVWNNGATRSTDYTITVKEGTAFYVNLNVSGLLGGFNAVFHYTFDGDEQADTISTTWTGFIDGNTVAYLERTIPVRDDTRLIASSPFWWVIGSDTTISTTYTYQYKVTV